MRQTHWYLRGWEYEPRTRPNGSVERVLVYKGEYYQVMPSGRSLVGLKLGCFGCSVLLWIVLIILLTHISRGASLFFVGGACALTLIPAIYLEIGCLRLLGVPKKMTFRDVHASFYRIRLAAKWVLALMAVCFAGECFYLIYRGLGGYAIAWPSECLWLLGSAAGFLAALGELLLLNRRRVEVCPPSAEN